MSIELKSLQYSGYRTAKKANYTHYFLTGKLNADK